MLELISSLNSFVNQWVGTAIPKLFLLFLALLLSILVVAAVWDKKVKTFGALVGAVFCLLLLSLSFGETISSFYAGLDNVIRIRVIAVFISFATLLFTLYSFVKTGLHLRYTLLWLIISIFVLLTALFPAPLQSFPSIVGLQYGTAVSILAIFFLLLLSFHLSVVVSKLLDRQQFLLKRLQRIEREVLKEAESNYPAPLSQKKDLYTTVMEKMPGCAVFSSFELKMRYGTSLTAPFIILIGVVGVFLVGSLAPQVMIGDEVTHFYMMKTQAADLQTPNFTAEIPTGGGGMELRNYPHPNLWHYLGAVLFKATGGSFLTIQLYQGLFLAQLLGVTYLLARSRGGVETRAALIYLLLIVSMPMTLIFSVAFYQGVPMTAQVLTSFYLLRKNRWILASTFLCFALGLKVTAILFFPAFFLYLLIWTYKRCSLSKTLAVTCCSLLLVGSFTFGLGAVIKEYGHATFYPVKALERIGEKLSSSITNTTGITEKEKHAIAHETTKEEGVSERIAEIIANHPGTLHIKVNYLVYGGVLLYLALGCTLTTGVWQLSGRKLGHLSQDSSLWLWGTGLSYIVLAAIFLKTAPDARFFLPGLVFCMLPMSERVVCLPKSRWIVIVFTTLAFMQSGYALSKTYQLRQVSPEIMEGIHFLEQHPPTPNRIFMYPEGNYRLFPASHEWYLGYYLREFWRGDNDTRISMLKRYNVGAIVVKKHLISPVDDDITNLGVYPPWFVKDIKRDRRFKKVFENSELIIFSVTDQER